MAPRISGTVTKAMDILDLFSDSASAWTVTQIAAATGIHKSTVVRLCATLEGRGYLRRDARAAYHIGPQVGRLASAFSAEFDLEGLIRPQLQRLRDETGESASFYQADGDARVCRYRENSHHAIRHVVDEGTRLPFQHGVVGRVLLAFSGNSDAEHAPIRMAGYLDAEGREEFTASVAVPVFTRTQALLGAIVVSGLTDRFHEAKRHVALQLIIGSCEFIQASVPVAMAGR